MHITYLNHSKLLKMICSEVIFRKWAQNSDFFVKFWWNQFIIYILYLGAVNQYDSLLNNPDLCLFFPLLTFLSTVIYLDHIFNLMLD